MVVEILEAPLLSAGPPAAGRPAGNAARDRRASGTHGAGC